MDTFIDICTWICFYVFANLLLSFIYWGITNMYCDIKNLNWEYGKAHAPIGYFKIQWPSSKKLIDSKSPIYKLEKGFDSYYVNKYVKRDISIGFASDRGYIEHLLSNNVIMFILYVLLKPFFIVIHTKRYVLDSSDFAPELMPIETFNSLTLDEVTQLDIKKFWEVEFNKANEREQLKRDKELHKQSKLKYVNSEFDSNYVSK